VLAVPGESAQTSDAGPAKRMQAARNLRKRNIGEPITILSAVQVIEADGLQFVVFTLDALDAFLTI
jgi:hypothetical protein